MQRVQIKSSEGQTISRVSYRKIHKTCRGSRFTVNWISHVLVGMNLPAWPRKRSNIIAIK